MKLVDIVMPCFNSEKFLSKSIESVILQTYGSWKLWFVDNGSTDESFNLALVYAKMNPRIRVCVEVGVRGPSGARNTALELISRDRRSELVAFIDSDDVWYNRHLEESVKALDDFGVDFVYSAVDLRFENGEQAFPVGIRQPPFEFPIYISTVVCSKECLSVGPFDSLLDGREDWDYWIRIREAGFKMLCLSKKLTKYTVRKEGMAGTWNTEKEGRFREKWLKYL